MKATIFTDGYQMKQRKDQERRGKKMDMKENTVYLSTSSYNSIKAENQKFHMLIDRLMESSTLSADKAAIEFDSKLLSDVVHIIYPEAYKKRLSYLRGQDTREAMRKMQEGE